MGFSSWLCTNTTKNLLVKIVHPGGHVELHDRPILAAEVMLRNPRCCVTYPHVFQQPWAIVEPNTTLMLGQKFYVVPICTIRKLQRLYSSKQSPPLPSSTQVDIHSGQEEEEEEEKDDDRIADSACWLFKNQNSKCLSQKSDNDNERSNSSSIRELMEKEDQGYCWDNDNCLMCLLTVGVNNKEGSSDDRRGGGGGGSTTGSSGNGSSSDEKKELMSNNIKVKRSKGRKGIIKVSSPRRCSSFDNWQPSLESINEE